MKSSLIVLFSFFILSCSNKKSNNTKFLNNISGKTWVLIEINGRKASLSKPQCLYLNKKDMMYSGNTFCNLIKGIFEISKDSNAIKFKHPESTRFTCEDIKAENMFIQVLLLADNYNIHNNKLMLNKGNERTLAKFEMHKKKYFEADLQSMKKIRISNKIHTKFN